MFTLKRLQYIRLTVVFVFIVLELFLAIYNGGLYLFRYGPAVFFPSVFLFIFLTSLIHVKKGGKLESSTVNIHQTVDHEHKRIVDGIHAGIGGILLNEHSIAPYNTFHNKSKHGSGNDVV